MELLQPILKVFKAFKRVTMAAGRVFFVFLQARLEGGNVSRDAPQRRHQLRATQSDRVVHYVASHLNSVWR